MLNFTVFAFTTLLFYPSLDANKPDRMTAFLSHDFIQGKLLYVQNLAELAVSVVVSVSSGGELEGRLKRKAKPFGCLGA